MNTNKPQEENTPEAEGRSASSSVRRSGSALEHKQHKCDCNKEGCWYCDGGLFSCDICGSIEGATTTHCPGRGMTEQERDDVYKGYIDYVDGQWVELPSKYSPAYWHDRRNWDDKHPEYVEGKIWKRERTDISA